MREELPKLRRLGLKLAFLAYMCNINNGHHYEDISDHVRYDPRIEGTMLEHADEGTWNRALDNVDNHISFIRYPENFKPASPGDRFHPRHKLFDVLPSILEELQIVFGGFCDTESPVYDCLPRDEIPFLGRKATETLHTYYIIDETDSAAITRPSDSLFDLLEWVTGIAQSGTTHFPHLRTIWIWQSTIFLDDHERRYGIKGCEAITAFNPTPCCDGTHDTGPFTLPHLAAFEEGEEALKALDRAGMVMKFWQGEHPPAIGNLAGKKIVYSGKMERKKKFWASRGTIADRRQKVGLV